MANAVITMNTSTGLVAHVTLEPVYIIDVARSNPVLAKRCPKTSLNSYRIDNYSFGSTPDRYTDTLIYKSVVKMLYWLENNRFKTEATQTHSHLCESPPTLKSTTIGVKNSLNCGTLS